MLFSCYHWPKGEACGWKKGGNNGKAGKNYPQYKIGVKPRCRLSAITRGYVKNKNP